MFPAAPRRRVARLAVIVVVALVTLGQIVRPGLNQDVRYVLGVLDSAAGAGLVWTEVWAHRPLAARGVVALFDALSPGGFMVREMVFRAWCVALAAGAAVLLWRGLLAAGTSRVAGSGLLTGTTARLTGTAAGSDDLSDSRTPQVAAWSALAAGAALAWAPGWDFAEPEWFAAVLAVAAIGLALISSGERTGSEGRAPRWPWLVAGLLLAVVVLLKFTTAATALAALLVIWAINRSRGVRTAVVTAVASVALFGLTVLIEPREWQWLRDMPTLNPPFSPGSSLKVLEGLVNSTVVSPVTLVGLVAVAWLLTRDRSLRRLAVVALVVLVVLVAPFVVQQQNFLYHLAALPVAAAGIAAAVAAYDPRVRIGLAGTGLAGLVVGVGVFAVGPRTRSENWWVGAIVVLLVLALGCAMALLAAIVGRHQRAVAPGRPDPLVAGQARIDGAGAGHGTVGGGAALSVLLIAVCLAPLLVTVSPRTAYSFSLAHNRTTAADNLSQTQAAEQRWQAVRSVLPAEDRVVYLSFAAPYWLGNPSPCRYVSPTFLQRARGERSDVIADTRSYAENLDCLHDVKVDAVVIETGWFPIDKARPEIQAAVSARFDCDRHPEIEGLRICPRR
ncbi:MAG: hypothetical protein Q4G46_08680 [Propionibacteriaceae bacterium]|nr:hypothetical protein [Propionibacteriaceae bacterium]